MLLWSSQGRIERFEQALDTQGAACQVGEWGQWSACGCGEGATRSRTRDVIQPAGFDGTPCPALEETEKCIFKPCPVDCKIGDWQTDGVCRDGVKTYTRKVLSEAANGGQACPDASQLVRTEACPVNCVMSDWKLIQKCDKECGGGVEKWGRQIITQPKNGGTACPANFTEDRVCNTTPCLTNCEMTPWSNWSDCSATCGDGTQTRTRSVKTPATYGGTPCGSTMETQKCTGTQCPANCEMTPWSDWSTCSASCGPGTQTRKRDIKKPASYGGAPCGDKEETRKCNGTQCDVNCVMTPWSDWSDCSSKCGAGTQKRTRDIKTPAAYNGTPCGDKEETRNCNGTQCDVNCVMTPWSEWSDCSSKCGAGIQKRTRDIKTPVAYNGTPCGAKEETRDCTGTQCKTNCQMTEWTPWSDCDKPCGDGKQTRTRKVLKEASFGGDACESSVLEERKCSIKPCPPVDCVASSWSEWSACLDTSNNKLASGEGGVRTRTRTIVTPSQNGGRDCGVLVEKSNCPINCKAGEWSSWSSCSAAPGEGGIKTRTRTVTRAAEYGGIECGSNMETSNCPINCKWSPWTDSPCTGGLMTRTRQVSIPATYGGSNCVGSTTETSNCPLDCTTGPWYPYNDCSTRCGTGTQMFMRKVLTPARNGGNCIVSEVRSCTGSNCPIDCEWGGWGSWSSCSNGIKTRIRGVRTQAANGGKSCPDSNIESATCPINCEWDAWGGWSPCANGITTRTRTVKTQATNGGNACVGQSTEQSNCPVNCDSSWSDWSKCSKDCGGGTQTRTLNVKTEGKNGGTACPSVRSQTQDCNKQACPKFVSWTQVPGKLKQVSYSGPAACGVNDANEVFCANFGFPWTKVGGSLKQISIDGSKGCGTTVNNEVFCADNVFAPKWNKVSGSLKQVDVSGNTMCGTTVNDEIFCATYNKGDWSKKAGIMKQISIDNGKACGVNAQNEVFCADNVQNPSWQKLGGLLAQIDIAGNQMCGVTPNNDTFCAPFKSSDWLQRTGSLKYVSVGTDNKAYGVTPGNDTFYTYSMG